MEHIHNRNGLFSPEPSELTLVSGKSVTLRSNHHCHLLVVSEWRPCAWSSEWKCRIWHEGAMPWVRICGKLAKPFPKVGLGKASPPLGPSSSAYERLTRVCKNSNFSHLLSSVLHAIHTLRSSVTEVVGAPPPECTQPACPCVCPVLVSAFSSFCHCPESESQGQAVPSSDYWKQKCRNPESQKKKL